MNTDKLHDAMNYIDDDMINAVDSLRRKKLKKRRKLSVVIPTVAAACVCVILCLAVIVMTKPKHYNAGILMGSDILGGKYDSADEDVKETSKPSPSFGTTKTPAVVPEATFAPTDIPDGVKPSHAPQKTPNATSVPKETSPNEDWADGEYDEPADATELPQDEPIYSLNYCVTVEVISSNNDSFNCIATGNNEYSEIKNGETIEIVAENDDVAEELSYYIGTTVKIYFKEYDYEGRIIASDFQKVEQ